MKSKRNVFLLIALLYFLSKLLQVILLPGTEESIVTPGWHTTIEYEVIYHDWFTPVFFIAIAAVYEYTDRSFPVILFWIHALLSTIPLISLALWPFYFNSNTNGIEDLLTEFRIMRILEWFFIITQATFTILLITRKSMFTPLRTS